jgi:hypothetical protein
MTSGSTCTLRVTATDRRAARVSVRRHQFTVGRPIEFDEASPHIAAIEYALGAIGGEVVNGLRAFASRRHVEVDRIEALVTGELENPLTYLEVVGERGSPRVTRLGVKVFVASPDPDAVRRIWDGLLDRLPLVSTWRSAIALQWELQLTT